MDCTHSVLHSRLQNTAPTPSSHLVSSSSDEDSSRPTRRRTLLVNIAVQLSLPRHIERDPTVIVKQLLFVSLNHINRHLHSVQFALSRGHLIAKSAPDFPPALLAFSGLGWTPCNSSRIVSFHKLHVVDLGITREFCDLINTVLQPISTTPLTRIRSTANDPFLALPCSVRLSSHLPFPTNPEESQVVLSGGIRRDSFPFFVGMFNGLVRLCP